MRTPTALGVGFLVALGLVGCQPGGSSGKPRVAYVTNGIANFWTYAERGALDAGQQFDVDAVVRMPQEGIVDQNRMIEDLLASGIDGVAISPINPESQRSLFEDVAEQTIFITHDSDAPESGRRCYVGMDNYQAGLECGKLVLEAMPDGGSVMIFVGRLGQLNAELRRQGVIDAILEREPDSTRRDPVGDVIKNEKYTILGTMTDDFDFSRAKSQAEDAIVKYPDLGCMVGLFEYNPPLCYSAVKEAGKVGQIEIVAFDENFQVLDGIVSGEIYGTVAQDPYKYGFESVRILAGLARGDESVLPPNNELLIPAQVFSVKNPEAAAKYKDRLQAILDGEAASPAEEAPVTEEAKAEPAKEEKADDAKPADAKDAKDAEGKSDS